MGAIQDILAGQRIGADRIDSPSIEPDGVDWPGVAPHPLARLRIAVLVPCYNEETAVAKVVADFGAALPHAVIYVYDNNSRDRTFAVVRATGAVGRNETHQGKGHGGRRRFSDVEADVYVLVDGDATYDAPSVRTM